MATATKTRTTTTSIRLDDVDRLRAEHEPLQAAEGKLEDLKDELAKAQADYEPTTETERADQILAGTWSDSDALNEHQAANKIVALKIAIQKQEKTARDIRREFNRDIRDSLEDEYSPLAA